MGRFEHHNSNCLEEREVKKGSGWQCYTHWSKEPSVFSQTSVDSVTRATLGRLLRDGVECVLVCFEGNLGETAERQGGVCIGLFQGQPWGDC